MLTNKRIVAVAIALGAFGFAASAAIRWNFGEPGPRVQAAWAFKADRLSQLATRADAIVVARAGKSTHSRFAFSDNGEDALPFEITEFQVISSVVGPPVGARLDVERAGGLDPDGVTHHDIDADGGEFVAGATYVLFLEHQEDGPYFYQLNDQARFQVRADRLDAVDEDDPVAASLHGQHLAEALALIEQSMH